MTIDNFPFYRRQYMNGRNFCKILYVRTACSDKVDVVRTKLTLFNSFKLDVVRTKVTFVQSVYIIRTKLSTFF